jgi:hypothetical protein
MLGGGNYATSFFETNPPLILYLTVPVCFIAELFSINPLNIAYCYFSILALMSVVVSYALLKRLVREPLIRYLTFMSLLGVMFLLPASDFGEREHIAMLFATPYLFAAALTLNHQSLSQRQAILIGLFAGIGFALKPYFLIPLCLIEAFFILDTQRILGWVRTESLTILSVMLVYLAAVWVFHPAYFHIIIPLVNRYYFLSIVSPGKVIFANKLYNFAVATLIASFFFYKNNRYSSIILMISLMQIGFMAALIATRTDWYYHMLPAIGFSILQISFCLATTIAIWVNERKIGFSPQLIAVMGIYLFYFLFILSGTPPLSENLLITFKWLILLSLTTFATLMIYLNKRMSFIALPFLAGILYFGGLNTARLEASLIRDDGYFFIIFDFILAWVALNIGICLLGTTNLNLRWVSSLQKMLCFTLFVAIIYFYPMHRIYVKYIREDQNIIRHISVINYLKQFPTRGGVYCFTTNDPSVCVPLSYYTAHEFSSRQPGFWWIRGMSKLPVDARLIKDREYLLNIVAQDLKNNHPQWIIYNPVDFEKFPANFNLIQFLSLNKNFRDEWAHYEFKTTIPRQSAHMKLVNYYLYERKF